MSKICVFKAPLTDQAEYEKHAGKGKIWCACLGVGIDPIYCSDKKCSYFVE